MEDRMPVQLGGVNGSGGIRGFEAAALEMGSPELYFPLSGFDGRSGATGWIDRRGMVPLRKAGELSAVDALGIIQKLIYGMYEDMDLCLMPENCRMGMDDIYVDKSTMKIRVVFMPAQAPPDPGGPARVILGKASAAASGMIRISEIRARGYLERAVRILSREDLDLESAVGEVEALKKRAFRLSDPSGARLDFGNIFV